MTLFIIRWIDLYLNKVKASTMLHMWFYGLEMTVGEPKVVLQM